MHHQNQLMNFRNHYNHILESILQLFNSTSQFLLKMIFDKLLVSYIFVGKYDTISCLQSEQLSNDLKIYLIKFADKICRICQGDLCLNAQFLSNIVKTIIPTLIITKEQIELENQTLPHKLDQSILKNVSSVISDSIQTATDKFWSTLKSKVVFQYCPTS